MKTKIYIAYIIVSVILVVLKISGIIGWVLATSFLWFPICVTASLGVVMMATADLGVWLKNKHKAKRLKVCENCLFKKTVDLINATRKDEEKIDCIGRKMGASIVDGRCSHFVMSDD